MFILTSLTLPPEAATAFSSTGANCLQGPHQGAQKSTSTGCLVEAVSTSSRKDAAVTSLTAVPPFAVPPAIDRSTKCPFARSLHGAAPAFWQYLAPPSGLFAQSHNQRLMARRAQEFDEIGARQAGGLRIDQRMKIEAALVH